MGVKLRSLAIDCNDPERLAAFWSAVLDWHIVSRDDDGAIQIGPADQPDVRLSFELVPWIVLADPEGNEFCLLGRPAHD